MSQNTKRSLLVLLLLAALCLAVLLWHTWRGPAAADDGSSAVSAASQASSALLSSVPDSASSVSEASSPSSSPTSSLPGLVSEDQPDSPNLNYEVSGSSYDDILVPVLTCLLSQNMAELSSYVGEQGLRLSPTGTTADRDVILSSADTAGFFQMAARSYGTYPGSGESILCTPSEYYQKYITPAGFDFASSVTAYNDAADLAKVSDSITDPKTVSYEYAASPMDWTRIILVFGAEESGDVLCQILYQDPSTD